MKRELFIHFAFWFSFFVFISIFKHYFALTFWPFWLGGLIGIFMPDIDHLLYLYLRPQELTSQRTSFYFDKKELNKVINLLYETRYERKNLIFHTIAFQLIFLILAFWMMTSSGSLLGRGIVLSFALHLSIDQAVDLSEIGTFDNWMKLSPIKLNFTQAKTYTLITILLILSFGFFL